jgi:type I restriction enzyme R subunit
VDKNTYALFDLEPGVPTDAYELEQAVNDGFLVPPRVQQVDLRFPREGIDYDDLSDEEKAQWEALDWGDDVQPGSLPERVNAAAINSWLFNTDTVDKVLKHLMQHGHRVDGGDRLAKTVIFARNHDHAMFIERRFNHHYPHLKGEFARVIDNYARYAQSLIDAFSQPDKAPHIAISVDMLDTGIDVPEIANLVFFKPVYSKIKFWQMLGRGTRLCPNLFGPGEDKPDFRVFDSLDDKHRLESVPGAAEEGVPYDAGGDALIDEREIRDSALGVLKDTVAAMNLDNFIVRGKRRLVEKYKAPEAWSELSDAMREELLDDVAPLPSERKGEPEEAKRFDLLMFNLELALLKGSKRFDKLKKQLVEIASALDEQVTIPIIAAQHALILDILSDAWWEGVTVPLLELVRLRLRGLVQHIDKKKKAIIYTNFEDELGTGAGIDLPEVGEVDFARFKRKARHFLREHEDHITIAKLKHGKPLTPTDIAELQQMLLAAGIGEAAHIEKASEIAHGLGPFIRSLVGLDRGAVSDAFSEFLSDQAASADQIEFIDMVIEHLTEKGVMDPGLLYESPFIDIAPSGPEQVFDIARAKKLVGVIKGLNESAAG